MKALFKHFRSIVVADFEFGGAPGDRPKPVCLVAHVFTADSDEPRVCRYWCEELAGMKSPPYPIGDDALVVAYYASAELSCHLALGWQLPRNVLDLYVEFRRTTNGLELPCGSSLLGALVYFGLPAESSCRKDNLRALALRGGPYSDAERTDLLDYCASDVRQLAALLNRMADSIEPDVGRAQLRGHYMAAAARIEWNGIPIDEVALCTLRDRWTEIPGRLIADIDRRFGVYDGNTLREKRFAELLDQRHIPWPRLASGRLALDDETFADMARAYPELAPLRELRTTLSKLRLGDLAVGSDGRNRTLLSAFRAKTSRNQPSNTQMIFGPATWIRGLIRPPAGHGIAYIDWSQQEFGIAAALSADTRMLAAYASGDPYLAFAKQARAVPPSATSETHGAVREQFKQTALAVQYGMGAEALAVRIGRPTAHARELLDLHRRTYEHFWDWSDAVVDYAMLHGRLWTTFGWHLWVGANANARSLRNFPMQANGAEMLRLACILAVNSGVAVAAPVHDAILIEAPISELDEHIERALIAMEEASSIVLNGFELTAECKYVTFPGRYMDKRGESMWKTVWSTIGVDPDARGPSCATLQ